MKRSVFRRRPSKNNNPVNNDHVFGWRALIAKFGWADAQERSRAAAQVRFQSEPNLPGETNRQFAERMRAAKPAVAEKPKRVRPSRAKKAVAA